MATLELEGLSKRYGRDIWGLRPTDLRVEEHEFLVLLGPSGCGKSTTVRLVAGLEEPTSGSIRIAGREVTGLPPRKRDVSMVFQNYAVWPHLTVFENIAFGLRMRRQSSAEIKATVREAAELVRISELLERYPSQLSGGQRQRVAVARALAVRPKIFLMDEPLSNLDAKLRIQTRTELKAIHQRTQATTVFVTHDQSEAMSLADRIVVMRDGAIVQVGDCEDVYHRCATVFVAGFIGSPPMNFFDAAVVETGQSLALRHESFDWPADERARHALRECGKRRVILAVRPEDILLGGTEDALFTAPVQVVEPQGSHQVAALKLGELTVRAMTPPTQRLAPGEGVGVRIRGDRVHLFDAETEERLN